MFDESLQGIAETRACHCLRARKRARQITRMYERELRPYGLRATQFSILAALAQTGPLAFSRLADILGLERTTLSRVAGIMERNGWLSLAEGTDARVRLIAVTSEGTSILAEAFPAWKRVQDSITQNNPGCDHDEIHESGGAF